MRWWFLFVVLFLFLGCEVGEEERSRKGREVVKKLEERWKKAYKDAEEACAKADKGNLEDVLRAFEKCKEALDVLPFGKRREEMEKKAKEWNVLLRKMVRRRYIELMARATPLVLKGDIRGAVKTMKDYPEGLESYSFSDIEDGLKRYRGVLEKQDRWTDSMRRMYRRAVELAKSGDMETIFREAREWVKEGNRLYNDGVRMMKENREAGLKKQQEALFHLTLVQVLLIGALETELSKMSGKERKVEYLETLRGFGESRQISGYITKRKKLLKVE